MDIQLSKEELVIINKVAEAAAGLNRETYLVGGFVRDKILNRRTTDADFVCVGDALELAQLTAAKFSPAPSVEYFKNFGTAHIKINKQFDLEFVGARKESYSRNSRKPDVEQKFSLK